MPQATRSDDHRTYRCYLRGPDGIRELSPCGPGARVQATGGGGRRSTALRLRRASRPPRPPGVLQVFDLQSAPTPPSTHRHRVEPNVHITGREPHKVLGCHRLDLPPLEPGDRILWGAEAIARPRLHLYERQNSIATDDEIHLPTPKAVVPGYYHPPVGFQVGRRGILASTTQTMGRVLWGRVHASSLAPCDGRRNAWPGRSARPPSAPGPRSLHDRWPRR